MPINPPRLFPRVLLCLGLGAVVASTVAGCAAGGSGGTPLTKEEFLKQGNAVCAAGNARIASAQPVMTPGQPPSGAAGTAFFDALMVEVQKQIDGIRALTPPAELKSDVDAFTAAAQTTLDKTKADGADALFAHQEDPFKDVNAMALKIGLNVCASSE